MLLKVIWLDIDNKSISRYMTYLMLILDLATVMLSKNAPVDQDKSTKTLDSHYDKDKPKPKMRHIKLGFLMYKSL